MPLCQLRLPLRYTWHALFAEPCQCVLGFASRDVPGLWTYDESPASSAHTVDALALDTLTLVDMLFELLTDSPLFELDTRYDFQGLASNTIVPPCPTPLRSVSRTRRSRVRCGDGSRQGVGHPASRRTTFPAGLDGRHATAVPAAGLWV